MVKVLEDWGSPAGCFADQMRVYFNRHMLSKSEYTFLKSLCHLKTLSEYVLPEATNETITACGQNRTLPVFRGLPDNLEFALDELQKRNVRQFAVLLSQGTAMLQEDITFSTTDLSRLDVVIMGQLPQGWAGMTQPPAAAQLMTKVDLNQHHILVMGADMAVCLQDLHLFKGKVCCIGCCLSFVMHSCGQGTGGGAVSAAGTASNTSMPCIKAMRCVIEDCKALSWVP